MIKKILLMFKANWLCDAVTKLITGISVTVVVLKYVKDQVAGSDVGTKVTDKIDQVLSFLDAVLSTLRIISGFVCGSDSVEASTDISIDQALADLKRVKTSLK